MTGETKPKWSLAREFKRRKVLPTCILYIVVCWGLMGVGDLLLPALGMEYDETSRSFLYIAVLGFPVAFALSWFLQITPQGIVLNSGFKERRVLNNIPPVDDRRRDGLFSFLQFRRDLPEYDWVITALNGPLTDLSFGIDRMVHVGRDIACELSLVSASISREHARLYIEDRQLYVEDENSANGTFVNGRRLKTKAREALDHKDEVRFHDIAFTIERTFANTTGGPTEMKKETTIQVPDDA